MKNMDNELGNLPGAYGMVSINATIQEQQLASVRQNGLLLQHIEDQTEALCIEAVTQNAWTLRYVKNKTAAICLAAVKQNGWMLYLVKQTDRELTFDELQTICLSAVKQNGLALEYVKQQTDDICLEAVKHYGTVLKHVKKQTPEIVLATLKQNHEAFDFMDISSFSVQDKKRISEILPAAEALSSNKAEAMIAVLELLLQQPTNTIIDDDKVEILIFQ